MKKFILVLLFVMLFFATASAATYTATVTKKSITGEQPGIWYVTFHLQLKKDGVVGIDKDYTYPLWSGQNVVSLREHFLADTQRDCDLYEEQQNIFDCTAIDASVQYIMDNLIY